MQANLLVDDFVLIAVEYLTGLGVDVFQSALLVEEQNAYHRCVEDRPVAQGTFFVESLLIALTRHILLGADDH